MRKNVDGVTGVCLSLYVSCPHKRKLIKELSKSSSVSGGLVKKPDEVISMLRLCLQDRGRFDQNWLQKIRNFFPALYDLIKELRIKRLKSGTRKLLTLIIEKLEVVENHSEVEIPPLVPLTEVEKALDQKIGTWLPSCDSKRQTPEYVMRQRQFCEDQTTCIKMFGEKFANKLSGLLTILCFHGFFLGKN